MLIIEKANKSDKMVSEEELISQIAKLIKSGKSLKDLSAELAEVYGMNKKEIYKIALSIK